MDNFKSFRSALYSVNDSNVKDIALTLFRYQAIHNPVYAKFIKNLGVRPEKIDEIRKIPFLPISLFKTHTIKTGRWQDQTFFTSSGTTGATTSRHHVADVAFYLDNAEKCFVSLFGPLEEYHILAIMPSYLERENSSLVAMINSFIQKSKSEYSRFYLYEYELLVKDVQKLKKLNDRKILVWGVSFALLDLAEKYQPDLSDCIVFETGGMKGRRKELTRQELHTELKKHFNVHNIYSEYGMTELLSQAYTRGGDIFYPSPWMKIMVREVGDPFENGLVSQTGGLNVMDLANFHTVAFVETEDAGKVFANGTFEVMGRLDNSDVRGCNLLVE